MPAELGRMFAAAIGQVATADLVFLWLILLEIKRTCEVESRCSAIRRAAPSLGIQRPASL